MRPIQAETETGRIVPMRYIAPSIMGEVTLKEQSWEPVPMKQVGTRVSMDDFEALRKTLEHTLSQKAEDELITLTHAQTSRILSHLVHDMLEKVASGVIRVHLA